MSATAAIPGLAAANRDARTRATREPPAVSGSRVKSFPAEQERAASHAEAPLEIYGCRHRMKPVPPFDCRTHIQHALRLVIRGGGQDVTAAQIECSLNVGDDSGSTEALEHPDIDGER